MLYTPPREKKTKHNLIFCDDTLAVEGPRSDARDGRPEVRDVLLGADIPANALAPRRFRERGGRSGEEPVSGGKPGKKKLEKYIWKKQKLVNCNFSHNLVWSSVVFLSSWVLKL